MGLPASILRFGMGRVVLAHILRFGLEDEPPRRQDDSHFTFCFGQSRKRRRGLLLLLLCVCVCVCECVCVSV